MSIIARLLHLANSHPPDGWRDRFYAMKERILAKYGKMERQGNLFGGDDPVYDWQEFIWTCWGCCRCEPGQGHYRVSCNGDGVFDRLYVGLERWHFGGYVFHRPAARRGSLPDGQAVTFRGRVEHQRYGSKSLWACFLLALRFDPYLAWNLTRASAWWGRLRWKCMGLMDSVWYFVRAKTCWTCKRRYRFGSECPSCGQEDDGLPF